ncbi:Phosphatidylinositol-glycan-specific phospholipase D [Acropora cervicornis]|uniref:Phosphatidylinositol-glycan-specific phospholipase D n=1 Tax=Acropora cervicornis TaxID=6130 RepID=A0AAD9QT54_ACRCE|nr:Phosphatidylinositol-glycan-specific phospholipase D [Acropora cervicornis]
MATLCNLFFLLCFLPARVTSCGMSTHIDIAHQAITWFKDARNGSDYREIILKNQDAFIAGNPYPDAMYSSLCYSGKFHFVSEDTHWAPFLNATVNYIRKKYPKPWDQETEKLVAFTLGFVSHQVADVTWHSLGIKQGFLTTMGDVNFFGSFPAAHPVGDIGGDMVASFEGDTSQIPTGLKEWYLPSRDLEEIYLEYYGEKKISREEIEVCSASVLLAWIGERIAGGVADMAAWSVLLWHRTIDMLEHGTQTCTIPKSPLFINCSKTNSASTSDLTLEKTKDMLKNPGKLMILHNVHLKNNLSEIKIRKSKRGSYFSISKSLMSKMNKEVKGTTKNGFEYQKSQRPVSLQEDKDNQKVSLVFGNFGGVSPSLVISAPGYGIPGNSQHGRVYFVDRNRGRGLPDINLNLDSDADKILDGSVENGRFGTALAVVDLNKDGIDDLAVSAPSTGANSLQYKGTVYVFYGAKKMGLGLQPTLTIQGSGRYYNLGTSLMGADVDGDGFKDLIIGSPYAPEGGPQRGSVAVFLAKTKREPESEIMVHDADWLLVGKQNYSWFGHSMTVGNISGEQKDIQSVGKVYMFEITLMQFPRPIATITGTETFMKLGTALSVGNPYNGNQNDVMLAVSAATQSSVYMLNLTRVLRLRKDLILTEMEHNAVFEGDRSFARFGWDVGLMDINQDGIKDLLFSSPFRTNDITEEIRGAEEGGLFVFYGGYSFPSGNATRGCLEVDPCPGEKASIMVKSVQEQSRLGSSFISVPATDHSAISLVISSPRSSSRAFHGGSVNIIHPSRKLKQPDSLATN